MTNGGWRVEELTMSTATDRLVTPVSELLGVRYPVLLAPMGDTAGGRLAAAVTAAGGFGVIGGGYANRSWLERELPAARGVRFGVGFITFALDANPDALDVALAASPTAIQLSFGDPRPYVDRIRDAGALLICQVQSSAEVTMALEADADIIIAQGQDSGGHGRPDRGTFALVPSVVDRVSPTPVVAAGGVADGRGMAAALMLGAAGVSIGTRFVACAEAISSAAEQTALVVGRAEDTIRTSVFDVVRGPSWPEGHDGRAIRNRLVADWSAQGLTVGTPDHRVTALKRRFAASAPDDLSMRPVWAGEGIDLIGEVLPVAVVMDQIVTGASRLLRRAGDIVAE